MQQALFGFMIFFLFLGVGYFLLSVVFWLISRKLAHRGLEAGQHYCRACRFNVSAALDYSCTECGKDLLPNGLITANWPIRFGSSGAFWGLVLVGFGVGCYLGVIWLQAGASGPFFWIALVLVSFSPSVIVAYTINRIEHSSVERKAHAIRLAFMDLVEANRAEQGMEQVDPGQTRNQTDGMPPSTQDADPGL